VVPSKSRAIQWNLRTVRPTRLKCSALQARLSMALETDAMMPCCVVGVGPTVPVVRSQFKRN
jgi:hypothetical protein